MHTAALQEMTTAALQSICWKWAHTTTRPQPHTIVKYVGTGRGAIPYRCISEYPPEHDNDWTPILRIFPEGTIQSLTK